jgi:hypothetical protein
MSLCGLASSQGGGLECWGIGVRDRQGERNIPILHHSVFQIARSPRSSILIRITSARFFHQDHVTSRSPPLAFD